MFLTKLVVYLDGAALDLKLPDFLVIFCVEYRQTSVHAHCWEVV